MSCELHGGLERFGAERALVRADIRVCQQMMAVHAVCFEPVVFKVYNINKMANCLISFKITIVKMKVYLVRILFRPGIPRFIIIISLPQTTEGHRVSLIARHYIH